MKWSELLALSPAINRENIANVQEVTFNTKCRPKVILPTITQPCECWSVFGGIQNKNSMVVSYQNVLMVKQLNQGWETGGEVGSENHIHNFF